MTAENAIDNSNVTLSARVKASGVAYWAPKGTNAPTTYTAPDSLGEEFVSLGNVSEDGWTESTDSDSNDFKDINGDTVLSKATKSRSFKIPFIEPFRVSVLKLSFNAANVETDTDGSLKHVKVTNDDSEEGVLVLYELLTNGGAMMYVIKHAKPTDFDDVSHNGSDLMTRTPTFACLSDGDSVYDMYPSTAATSSTGA
jgi:hypothetical protein